MEKYIERECKIHGNTEYVLEGRGYYRCKACRSESVTRKRKKLKTKLINEFGGKCTKCCYSKCQDALEFHHVDSLTKSFGLSAGGLTKSYEKLLAEAKKCILVCSNCHKEIHSKGSS